MKLSEFDYHLPEELIAQTPLEKRDTSRLMVLDRKTETIEDKHFYDILDYLHEGDILVRNNTLRADIFENSIEEVLLNDITEFKGKDVIVGYFAITNKAINIKGIILSKTKKKRLIKFAQYDNVFKTYSIALPLIGQIGKNYNKGYNRLISGDLLLKLACDKIKLAQNILGGRFAFLECEDKPQLKEFYEKNGFVCFGKRNLEKDERENNEGEYLLQMLCDLSKN